MGAFGIRMTITMARPLHFREVFVMSDESLLERFVSFHGDVGVYSERVGWLLERLQQDLNGADYRGLDILVLLHRELDALVLRTDCSRVVSGEAS
jgi:hypothetical protein